MRVQLTKLDTVPQALQPLAGDGEHLWADVGCHDAPFNRAWLATEDSDNDVTRPRR